MPETDVPYLILTAARCDVPGCSTDVRAEYLAHTWQEAANYHAADLVAAGWRIGGEYRCPRCVPGHVS